MIIISKESIDKVIKRFKQPSFFGLAYTIKKLEKLTERFGKKQPNIFFFTWAVTTLLENSRHQELLVRLASIIWQAFEIQVKNTPLVTEEHFALVSKEPLDDVVKLFYSIKKIGMGTMDDINMDVIIEVVKLLDKELDLDEVIKAFEKTVMGAKIPSASRLSGAFTDLWRDLMDEKNEDVLIGKVLELTKNQSQPHLFEFTIMELLEDEEIDHRKDGNLGFMFSALTTLINCMDRAVNGPK